MIKKIALVTFSLFMGLGVSAHKSIANEPDAQSKFVSYEEQTKLEEKAKAGDTEAQYQLGKLWADRGIAKPDYLYLKDAVFWLEKAAKSGHVLAQVELGKVYIHPYLLSKSVRTSSHGYALLKVNELKGKEWFEVAAKENNPEAQYYLGVIYQNGLGTGLKDLEQSKIWYEKALANGNDKSQTRLEEVNKAISEQAKKSSETKNKSNSLVNKGLEYAKQKQFELAIQEYNAAIKLHPYNLSAYINRGNALYFLKKYELAIKDYDIALQINPKHTNAYFNRGNAYQITNKHQLAIDDYTKAIELDPKYDNAYISRGNSYLKLDQQSKALDDWKRSCQLGNASICSWLKEQGYN